MADGVLHRVAELQVSDLLVPVVTALAVEVGASHEGLEAVQRELRLKDVGGVSPHVGRRWPLIHQEDRHRPGACGNQAALFDGPNRDDELKVLVLGEPDRRGRSCADRDETLGLSWYPAPSPAAGALLGAFVARKRILVRMGIGVTQHGRVVGPGHLDADLRGVGGDED